MRPALHNHFAGTDTTTTGQAASPTTSPALATAADTAWTSEVRRLVAWGITQRLRHLQYGWNRMPAPALRQAMLPLQQWLRGTSEHPSARQVHALWARYETELRLVMPGRRRLDRIQHLITKHPLQS